MKIRLKNIKSDNKEMFVYEVDDEKGKKANINTSYLETSIKVLNLASKKITIRNIRSFEKFITNIKRATKYYDKMEKKAIETPNILHKKQDNQEMNEYHAKYIKYDKKAQALFSLHNGWYENFVLIVEEIKQVIEENYNTLKDLDVNDNDLLYVASRIDGILDKYKKKQKVKTL